MGRLAETVRGQLVQLESSDKSFFLDAFNHRPVITFESNWKKDQGWWLRLFAVESRSYIIILGLPMPSDMRLDAGNRERFVHLYKCMTKVCVFEEKAIRRHDQETRALDSVLLTERSCKMASQHAAEGLFNRSAVRL